MKFDIGFGSITMNLCKSYLLTNFMTSEFLDNLEKMRAVSVKFSVNFVIINHIWENVEKISPKILANLKIIEFANFCGIFEI